MTATPPTLPPELTALEQRFTVRTMDFDCAGQAWQLLMPRNSDDLISEADYVRDERLPYWADLWASSIVLSRHIVASDPVSPGCRSLEFGAGLGVPSMAALTRGYDAMVTDYYDDSMLFARRNALTNTGRDLRTRMVDWRALPDDLGRFDLVLAADILYEKSYAPLVARAVTGAIAPGGMALIADPGRVALQACLDECTALGATVRDRCAVWHEDGAAKHTITIYEVRLG